MHLDGVAMCPLAMNVENCSDITIPKIVTMKDVKDYKSELYCAHQSGVGVFVASSAYNFLK